MSYTGLAEFDNAVQKANVWLKDLMEQRQWQDRHRAYAELRVVLHALRDHLRVDEVAGLGAQLPMLVRGIYYEGWKPANNLLTERSRELFLSHITEGLRDFSVEPEQVVRAVFQVLTNHLSSGEIEEVKQCLPKSIRSLWL